jgi:hypothetical protein
VGVATSGSDVLSIADQSGKGKNVTAAGTPRLTSSVISSLPGIQFIGTGDSLGGTGSLWGRNAARTQIAVCLPTTRTGVYTSGGVILAHTSKADPTSLFCCAKIGTTTVPYSSGSANRTIAATDRTNAATVISLIMNPNPVSVSINGAGQTLDNTGLIDEGVVSGNFCVGNDPAYSSGVRWFGGYLCEVICFSRVLTTLELSNISHYFGNLYGITIAN